MIQVKILLIIMIFERIASNSFLFTERVCYGTNFCNSNPQNHIQPDTLSKRICFKKANLSFLMGTDNPVIKSDGESPAREVFLNPFCMDLTEVSNLQFLQFVKETKYKTEAEVFGDSLCFKNALGKRANNLTNKKTSTSWWISVKNASWKHPEGPGSNILSRLNHPVVHVSWNDANNYCKYFNKRLPTEAEWEYSCRGGLDQRLYPWGNNPFPKSKYFMNIWQGDFPDLNTASDGYEYTSPVDEFEQNKFHMKNIVGNVWEWIDDWWTTKHKSTGNENEKVKKGGSFLCHPSFCHRYRCAARSKNTLDTTAMNIGFRCASS